MTISRGLSQQAELQQGGGGRCLLTGPAPGLCRPRRGPRAAHAQTQAWAPGLVTATPSQCSQ